MSQESPVYFVRGRVLYEQAQEGSRPAAWIYSSGNPELSQRGDYLARAANQFGGLRAALGAVVAAAKPCPECGGESEPTTCPICNGAGEYCDAAPLLRELRSALELAKGGGR